MSINIWWWKFVIFQFHKAIKNCTPYLHSKNQQALLERYGLGNAQNQCAYCTLGRWGRWPLLIFCCCKTYKFVVSCFSIIQSNVWYTGKNNFGLSWCCTFKWVWVFLCFQPAPWALSRPQKFMTFVGIARILLDFEIFQESKIYDRSGNLFVFTQQSIIKSSWDSKYPIPNLMIHLFRNLPAQTGGEVLSSWWYS